MKIVETENRDTIALKDITTDMYVAVRGTTKGFVMAESDGSDKFNILLIDGFTRGNRNHTIHGSLAEIVAEIQRITNFDCEIEAFYSLKDALDWIYE